MDTAMIFAAGRGERMRPLTDHVPKPLLRAGGKPLIVWQIEALAAADIRHIVINHAWLGGAIETALGDGRRWGVRIDYSAEGDAALETAGGIARALPLLGGTATAPAGSAGSAGSAGLAGLAAHTVFLAVSGDIHCDFDYRTLRARAAAMRAAATPRMHLVMVPNPPYHPHGDFTLDGERLTLDGGERLTFANIGLYDTRMFATLAAQTPVPRMPLAPLLRNAIASRQASGERWDGRWTNVGTPAELAALDRSLSAVG